MRNFPCGAKPMNRWPVAGSQGMLGQDLVPALGARLGAREVTAVVRDPLDGTDRVACLAPMTGHDIPTSDRSAH